MIKLTHAGVDIDLPTDLFWEDEFSWTPVEQTVERSLTGALIVQVAQRSGGRPITLRSEDENSAWITRTVAESLYAWAAVPGREMTLTLRGTTFQVVFRHQESSVVEVVPVVHYGDIAAGDFYTVTLRLMEI